MLKNNNPKKYVGLFFNIEMIKNIILILITQYYMYLVYLRAKFIKHQYQKMKKIFYLIALIPFAFGCGGNKQNGVLSAEDSLTAVNGGQQVRIHDQDSSIQSFIKGFNEIQDNLDIIKEKEKIVTAASKDAETRKTKQEQIVEDIQSIYDIMNKNKQRLSAMRTKLNKSNKKNEELEKFITRLTAEIESKDGQIADLKTQLEQLNVAMTNLNTNYQEVTQESEIKTEKLNTAFYAFGTSKELIKNGVLTKEGGFIGLGKIQKMKEDFNKTYFTKVDVSTTNSIILGAKKAKLITTHPAGSYKFEGTDGKAEKLTIINAEDFWSVSKYLVVVID
jgi:predicted nuclease with TOPRIM domain